VRRRLLVLFAVLVGAATVVVGASAASAAGVGLDAVTVAGNPGEKPTVTFAKPFSVKASTSVERTPGTGDEAATGSQLLFDYVILNGRTGAEVETSYGKSPVTLVLDKSTQPALVDGLIGASAGSRVLVAVAPKDGLAKNGAAVGVKKNDTLLFVMDVKGVTTPPTPLPRATGTAVVPPAGLPAVTLAGNGAPTITMPKTDPPANLVVQPLIQGDGAVVQAGDTITVHYTGVIWKSAKTFDSSWKRSQPAQFAIGTSQVIAGWDEGLVGQTVGSQVLLVVPPDKGYGAGGNSQAGIKGTDTLVFVVDILAIS
jgi:peptidylprolyl isomerase